MLAKKHRIFQLSEILEISPQTARRHLRNGLIKGIKIGKHWVVSEAEIERILQEGLPLETQ